MGQISDLDTLPAFADGDLLVVRDISDATNKDKKALWSLVKSTLKTYLDTLYVALTGAQTIAGAKTFSSNLVIGTGAASYPLTVRAANSKTVAGTQNVGGFGTSDDLMLLCQVVGSATASERYTLIQSIEQGVGYRNLALNPLGASVGIGVAASLGKLHVDQSSATAAIPTLYLRQADDSEPLIIFDALNSSLGPIGGGSPVGAYYGRVRVYVQGVGIKWISLYD